jgi:hypothetical protein
MNQINKYPFKNRNCRQYIGDPPKMGTVELSIDWNKLVDILGSKAANNRSHKSSWGRAVTAKFIPNKP